MNNVSTYIHVYYKKTNKPTNKSKIWMENLNILNAGRKSKIHDIKLRYLLHENLKNNLLHYITIMHWFKVNLSYYLTFKFEGRVIWMFQICDHGVFIWNMNTAKLLFHQSTTKQSDWTVTMWSLLTTAGSTR